MLGKYLNVGTIYIVIWLLYNFHWNKCELPFVSALSNVFLFINFAISAYYAKDQILKKNNTVFFRSMNLLLLMFVLYGVYIVVSKEVFYVKVLMVQINNGSYLVAALRSFLPVYVCYVFAKKKMITEDSLKIFFWIFLSQALYVLAYTNEMHEEREFTNNNGYLFAALFPYVFLYKGNVLLQYILSVVLLAIIFSCAKRGAILLSSVVFLLLVISSIKEATSSQRFFMLFFLFLVFYVSYVLLSDIYQNSDFIQSRVEETAEGNSSGRDKIVLGAMEIWSASGMLNLLFGYGANGTLLIGGNFAHNDWVEIVVNQGVLGFVVYLYYWLAFVKTAKESLVYRNILISICILGLGKSIFSMWYSTMGIYITALLGFAIYKNEESKELTDGNL